MSNKFIGSSSGLTLVSGSGKARITPTYNSGIMPEGIKLAALADTIPDGYGVELITDGSMSSASNWTGLSATLSIVSGRLRVTNSTTATGAAYQTITTVAGRRYTAKVDVTAGTCANGTVYVGTSAGDSSLGTSDTDIGVISVDFWATGTTTYIHLENGCSTSGNYADYDTASVKVSEFVGVDETTDLATTVESFNVAIGSAVTDSFTSISNKVYEFSVNVTTASSRMLMRVGTTSGGFDVYTDSAYRGTTGKHTVTFVGNGSILYVTLLNDVSGSGNAIGDSFTVKQTGNLVVNGTFDVAETTPTGWSDDSEAGGSINSSGGLLNVVNTTSTARGSQGLSVTSNEKYVVSFDASGVDNASQSFYVATTSTGSDIINNQILVNGINSATFIASASTIYISFRNFSVGTTYSIDNISVRLADPDRSVNNDGLEIHGQITKSPVATGAELQAYSGFSANNFLQQPYNSALDFGTGDFYVMGWLNIGSTATSRYILDRGYYSGGWSGSDFQLRVSSTHIIQAYLTDDGYTSQDLVASTKTVNDKGYVFVSFVKKSNAYYLYLDGVLDVSQSAVNAVGSLSNTNAILRLGLNLNTSSLSPLTNGSLALWRIGAGAPTAEQIQFIYEQEKPLFQDNAKCTLQSSSSDVKALAYDDTTDILTVCTADHVTKFNGLKVVDDEARVATSVSTTGGRELYGA